MTAKECIIRRCKDCHEGRSDCGREDCQLYGLKRAVGGCNRVKAIRDYCRWCRQDLPSAVCTSVKCPIYVYLGFTVESTATEKG